MTPLRLALIYLSLSLVWILTSDSVVHWLWDDPAILHKAQTFKGWAFVSVTAMIVYLMARRLQSVIRRELATKRQHLEELRRKAYTDDLTGLANRRLGQRELSRLTLEHAQSGRPFYLLYLDLDSFKQINDTLGNAVGDQVIVKVGQRIAAALAVEHSLIRQGSDEFMVLLPGCDSEPAATSVAQMLLEAFSQPLVIEDMQLQVPASIGIARFPEDGKIPDVLIRSASLALHESKRFKQCYKFYRPDMSEGMRYRFDLEAKLRRALSEERLEVYYQPLYDGEQRIVGAEALARWQEDGEFISPADFIPIAEHTGHIRTLGSWVLARACTDTVALSQALGYPLKVSVNVSPKQFANGHLLEDVRQVLEASGLAPEQLILEITEGVFLSNIAEATDTLNSLVAKGITIALDDFGQGYSSLSYLRQHPFTYLKIDRMFVQGMEESRQDYGLVQASVAMAKALQLNVVAEGVETARQASTLSALGVDYLQGFFLARPMTLADYRNRLEQVLQAS
ncbi:putative bifunctional diguanylate cyclase/phosphodiesterase [Marinimicrobium alkaliphilum]|uniref:putative bifunctional diguanylate cyclase/phosphodiesterase n=1 Tax=Marinimicrobium alkaliphilum TaxID=2202654 RepID=UPI000DB9AA8F|nr:bifunctional diguanylate cyclase/phosphodiesterase [Marinimicrobium alkaliphilum]